jgi:voltage-gated potassium channel
MSAVAAPMHSDDRRRSLLGNTGRGGPSSARDAALGRDAAKRVAIAVGAVVAVTGFGTLGYLALGFGPLNAVYQTVTTVSTVGFREIEPLGPAGVAFTIVLIVVGVGTVLYNLGVLVEALTEGHLFDYLGRRRMDARIAGLTGHVIICGHGRVGKSAAEHLAGTGHPIVVVDSDPDRLEGLTAPHIVGDALKDDILREAGVTRARAMICALEADADTLYLTLSARALCPDLVIISRARTVDSKDKLVLAGATRAVNPQLIGGRRMAMFALHGDVAEFLDGVMHDEEMDFRVEQVRVHEGSPFIGRSVSDIDLTGAYGAQLLAIRLPDKGAFIPNPTPDAMVQLGTTLIVLGEAEQIAQVRRLGHD